MQLNVVTFYFTTISLTSTSPVQILSSFLLVGTYVYCSIYVSFINANICMYVLYVSSSNCSVAFYPRTLLLIWDQLTFIVILDLPLMC